MRQYLKDIFIVLLAAMLLAGCNKGAKIDSEVAASDQVMLRVGGRTLFSLNENIGQWAIGDKSFTGGNDEMSSFFHLDFDRFPSESGRKVTADLTWKVDGTQQSRSGVAFSVTKTEGDKIWLWASKEKIGAVIRN